MGRANLDGVKAELLSGSFQNSVGPHIFLVSAAFQLVCVQRIVEFAHRVHVEDAGLRKVTTKTQRGDDEHEQGPLLLAPSLQLGPDTCNGEHDVNIQHSPPNPPRASTPRTHTFNDARGQLPIHHDFVKVEDRVLAVALEAHDFLLCVREGGGCVAMSGRVCG